MLRAILGELVIENATVASETRVQSAVWYAALCKPRREMVAEQNLNNQGYQVFLPRVATQRRRNGRWIECKLPQSLN